MRAIPARTSATSSSTRARRAMWSTLVLVGALAPLEATGRGAGAVTTALGSDRPTLPDRHPMADWLPLEGPLLSGQLVVTVEIEGHHVRAIVDTGSQVSIVSEPFARDLELTPDPESTAIVDAHGGRVDGKRARAETLLVGRRVFRDVSFLVLGEQHFRVLLGADVLHRLDLVIAPDEGLLGVFDASAAPIDDDAVVVPLSPMRTLLTVNARAKGKRAETQFPLLVDTGASLTAIPARVGIDAGLPADLSFSSTTLSMGGAQENRGRFVLDALVFDPPGHTIANVYANAGVIDRGQSFGLLGNDVLFRTRTTLSFQRAILALAPIARRPAARTAGPSGTQCDGACVQVELARRSPSGKAVEQTRSDRCLRARVSRAFSGRTLEMAVVGFSTKDAPLPGGIRVLTTVGPAGVDVCLPLPLGMARSWPDDARLSILYLRAEGVRWSCDPLETHCAVFTGPLSRR